MGGFLNLTRIKTVNKVVEIDVDRIVPNPAQPRLEFGETDISSLADSIKTNGIIQPLTVRRYGDDYQLVAGERRLRAAKMCGLQAVPCIIVDINDRNSAILALVENIQRQDLNCFEQAMAIERLISFYGLTQEDAAMKLGKAQSTIANKLRLLRLNSDERDMIVKYGLTERHARSLLRIASPEERRNILEKIIKNKLNVERTDKLIDDYLSDIAHKESLKRHSKIFENVRSFVNTINRAVENMQAAGISADSRKFQNEDYIEYRVRIPIQNRVN